MSHPYDSDPAIARLPSPDDGEEFSDAALERSYERGERTPAEIRLLAGRTAISGEPEPTTTPQLANGSANLELVTDDHIPQPGAPRTPKLRKPPKPRNWRERMAADQAPAHQRVTPLGHDPHITVHRGGHPI